MEATASGRASDTACDRETGLLFDDQRVDGLIAVVGRPGSEGLDCLDPA